MHLVAPFFDRLGSRGILVLQMRRFIQANVYSLFFLSFSDLERSASHLACDRQFVPCLSFFFFS